MNRIGTFILGIWVASAAVQAQKLDPVQWTLTSEVAKTPAGSSVPLHLIATVQDGWHLYSLTTPKGGPIPTTDELAENPGVSGSKLFQPPPERQFDKNFNLDTETFEKSVDLPLSAEISKTARGTVELTAQVRYQACNDRLCLPPRKKTAAFAI